MINKGLFIGICMLLSISIVSALDTKIISVIEKDEQQMGNIHKTTYKAAKVDKNIYARSSKMDVAGRTLYTAFVDNNEIRDQNEAQEIFEELETLYQLTHLSE